MNLCGKCGTKPVRAEDQRYCAECHAEYQRDYKDRARDKRDRAAFFRGAEDLRTGLLNKFEKLLFVEIPGAEVAQSVRELRVTYSAAPRRLPE